VGEVVALSYCMVEEDFVWAVDPKPELVDGFVRGAAYPDKCQQRPSRVWACFPSVVCAWQLRSGRHRPESPSGSTVTPRSQYFSSAVAMI